MDPSSNDSPLDFNSKRSHSNSSRDDASDWHSENSNWRHARNGRDRNKKDHTLPDSSSNSRSGNSSKNGSSDNIQPWAMMQQTIGPAATPPLFPVMATMSPDPSLFNMMTMPAFNQFSFMDPTIGGVMTPLLPPPNMQMKEVIRIGNCTLLPPPPNAPPPSTRERPDGCRTVFVGGLPEKITEDIIKEIFVECGPISVIRMSKKNFCHIRFETEEYVNNSIALSGYRICIESEEDGASVGRLHIDYAQARDDHHEWECQQRALQREMRHREHIEQEMLHPPSPPPVIHFSEHEARQVIDRLKSGLTESFANAVATLVTWMDRGECRKKSAGVFYSLLQGANSHVRRLIGEKDESENELTEARNKHTQRLHSISVQFDDIERVFTAASRQKVWDHFTKAQRKNIELWKNQIKNVKGTYQVDNEEGEAEMDLSDEAETEQSGKEDEPSSKRMKCDESSNNFVDANERLVLSSKVYMVKEENDSLKCQLDAYKNELDLVKMENMNEVDAKEGQIKMLQQTLQGVQQQLLKFKKDEIKRQQTEDEPSSAGKAMATLTGDNLTNGKDELKANKKSLDVDVAKDDTEQISSTHQASKISNRQARLIGLISTFLHVHPFGASIDYIWSYLQQIDPALLPSDVENLMLKFPNVFKQRFSGIGVRIERKWIFEGFNDTPT